MIDEMNRQALIFPHIPKTAGTTLNRIIEWQSSPLSMFTMDSYRIRATTERFKTHSEQRRRRLGVVRGPLYFIPHRPLHRKLKKVRLGVEDYLRLIVRTGTHSRTFSRCPVTLIVDRGVLNSGD